jgi:hypothetical protein
MNYYETSQPNPQAWGGINPQAFGQPFSQNLGIPGQAAYGQPLYGYQPYGQQPFGQPSMGQFWGPQRQLSHHEVNEVVRQLIPLLPQVLGQAQQPLSAIGYGGFGPRMLTQQDVNEVVRQILPAVPQIVALLQQGQQAGFGGFGQSFQQPYRQQSIGQSPLFHAAFGATGASGQRQLTPQDITEVARQLASVIPQVMGNLNLQRTFH